MTGVQLPYRPNVAAVVLNHQGLILACRRADEFKSWQLPQGGVDDGETPEQALIRELREEIGVDELEVLGRLHTAIYYEWPEHLHARGYRGQEQWYFLARLKPGTCIILDAHEPPEFEAFEWLTAGDLLERVGDFKKAAYQRALEELTLLFPGVIAE